MDSQPSQDPLESLMPSPDLREPVTPELSQATIPDSAIAAIHGLQSARVDRADARTTPPPSDQVPSTVRHKARTPTPPVSHISTPPPTIEAIGQTQPNRYDGVSCAQMSSEELAAASADHLRTRVTDLQLALQDAKTSAAHHKLQYQMLAQESTAAIERMAVEARMAQFEDEVIHIAEQAKVAATPAQPSPVQEGIIPIHKDLYQRMCRDIQMLTETNQYLEGECDQQQKLILRQESEIATLSDKVTLMRERIRESRDHLARYRRAESASRINPTPRSVYSTPHRGHVRSREQQPFAALLQASEMASQESARSSSGRAVVGRKGHTRNAQSMSSLPATPQRSQKQQPFVFQTPQDRQPRIKLPSTAPLPKTRAVRTLDLYSQPLLPVAAVRTSRSEDTVTASESNDNDSEAETDIIEQDEIDESQASRAASQMLRSSQDQQTKRDSFKGSGTMGEKTKQARLFGAIRKTNVDRDGEPPAKRSRTGGVVGLGIAGVRD